ncbi:MAG: 50S ribosome-binding GTPase [Methylococcales bacterium]|nr:50S ribosome-binding GTPase [Methylococcales bacterium]
MAFDYSDLIANVEDWADSAVNKGWINTQQADTLTTIEKDSSSALFVEKKARPLVVAFMGGTGVGKSSLLNKLAKQSIAKTGVERPTSREVTLFHHSSVSIHQLEEKFPLQEIQIAQHTEESNRNVLWIDMPDFDSTEEKNKNIVMQWLPFVDVLVYVVSPERYRDNKAWQLLLSEGVNHAWLFVMNQWDRGVPEQYDDFKKQLAQAGFHDPLIFKTISIEGAEDELPQLQSSIQAIATEKTVQHLETRGIQNRTGTIKTKLQQCLQSLGDDNAFSSLQKYQESSWDETEAVLKKGFDWPIKQASLTYSKTKIASKKEQMKLWDEWAQSRFNDYLDDLTLTADQKGFPSAPLRKNLVNIRQGAERITHTQTELSCRQALIHPGNLLQRIFLKFIAICEILLPLMAMGFVGFEVFEGFYDSATSNEEFLGVDFAVHSVLMVGLSWLIPYFILKKLQPSLEKAALQGLHKGLDSAMTRIELDIKEAITQQGETHIELTDSLKTLIDSCQGEKDKIENEQLTRMLVNNTENG